MSVDIKQIKKLRDETGASIADVRKALEETNGDYIKAIDWLKIHGIQKAEKKADRTTGQGLVESYIHANGKVGAMIEILCETDFVARTDDFKHLAHEVAMQVCAMAPRDVDTLLKQDYIRDSSMTIESLVKQVIGKLGENIVIKDIKRFEI